MSMELTREQIRPDNLVENVDGEGFLPDFCDGRNVFLMVGGAEFLAIILTLSQGFSEGDLWTRLALVSLFVQWVTIGSVALLCHFRDRLNALTTRQTTGFSYAIILGVTLALSVVAIWLIQYLYLTPHPGLAQNVIMRNLVICAIVTALMLRYFYVQHQWKSNTEAEARARIQALQARIRPHFLFNSMNTIANLTRADPDQAEKAVLDLADLFRVSLADKNYLTLEEELNVTKQYLSIEKHRLGDRITLEWRIDEDVDCNTKIPALILQPLVENALYHGIEPLTEGGTVTISLHNLPDAIEVSVSNPLSTVTNQQRHKGNRMAQDNIRQRLLLAFGEQGRLKIQARDEEYTVSFKIPK